MPVEFNSDWEYYTPDVEIEEARDDREYKGVGIVPMHGDEHIFRIFRATGTGTTKRELTAKELLFTEMWMMGFTRGEIKKAMGWTDFQSVRLWRKKLRLPPRKIGNYSVQRRKARPI